MMNLGYNNRWVRLVKDLLFFALAVWFVSRGSVLSVIAGLLFGWWYGRDAWFQAKALWQEKHYQPSNPGPTVNKEPEDNKITVTNLSDAKEVDFEKE